MHLSESEKSMKLAVDTLFLTNKSLIEKLKQSETESQEWLGQYDAVITSIDLQREKLKRKIEKLGQDLIDKVRESTRRSVKPN